MNRILEILVLELGVLINDENNCNVWFGWIVLLLVVEIVGKMYFGYMDNFLYINNLVFEVFFFFYLKRI